MIRENNILIKDVKKRVDQKMLKNPMKKIILYNISKDQNSKSGSLKNEAVTKT